MRDLMDRRRFAWGAVFVREGRNVNLSFVRKNWAVAAPLAGCAWAVASLAVAAEAAAPADSAATVASSTTAVYAAADDAVAQLCVGHGRQCGCAGCRAFYEACEIPCPPGVAGEMTPDMLGETLDREGAPLDTEPTEPAEPEPLMGPTTSVTSSLGAIAAASSASPGMIGDFFGGGYQYRAGLFTPMGATGPVVAVAGGDRIVKFADNNNPIPQDRFFFNYHLFANPVADINGQLQDVNRFTFGLEKAFWDGTTSLEFRVPFEAGVSNVQSVGQTTDTLAAEFGNLALATKVLLFQRGPWAVAGGLGMIFPTAEDAIIFDSGNEPIVTFANESFFLQPFLGAYYRPTPRLFSQFVAQANFDVSGSTVTFLGDSDRLHEQSLLFLDWSLGYWIYQTKRCDTWLTGIAPMIELHYTTTMEDLELPNFDEETLFEPDFRRDALNLTGGVLFGIGQLTSLRVAGVAPLRDETLIYDAEFGVQLIRRY